MNNVSSKTELLKHIEELKQDLPYRSYLEVREAVLRMRDHAPSGGTRASAYWTEELSGFEYMFDASPLIVAKLRHHTHHLTGLRDYDYRGHHEKKSAPFREKLKMLREKDTRKDLLVPENPRLGGFGYTIDGALYNIDTLKFYEVFIGMDQAGMLNKARAGERAIVLEIGSGWGGFAYQWKTRFPNGTYVLVDFPEVFLFAGTYLKSLFPDARFYFADGSEESVRAIDWKKYDFVFIPHFAWKFIGGQHPDIVVNMASFQEMTTAQVEGYISQCAAWGVPAIYSLNRDRSPYNNELTSVSSVIGKYYIPTHITVLPLQYTEMPRVGSRPLTTQILDFMRSLKYPAKPSIHSYRHSVGELR